MAWQIDAVHSHVGFSVKHMMVSTVRGHFKQFSATLGLDTADFARSTFAAAIDVASIDTANEQRDAHLRTNDFFDAAAHPQITFVSTGISSTGGTDYVVNGDLTIRGVTRPVALDVEFHGTNKNPWGKTVTGFSATCVVNRADFGLTYNAALELGGVLIGDKVKIEIEIEASLEA